MHSLALPAASAFHLAACLVSSARFHVWPSGLGSDLVSFPLVPLSLSLGGVAVGGVSAWLAGRRKTAAIQSVHRLAVEEAEQQFRAAAEGSLDAFYILQSVRDGEGRITDFRFRYLNQSSLDRFKAEAGSLIGTSYRKAMAKMIDEEQFARYSEVAETGTPLTVEFPIQGAKIKWLRHQVVKLGDGIAVTSSDRTEFKSIEDRIQVVAQFSETIFKNAPFSIIATDAKGTITAMNPEAQVLTGYSAAEMVGSASILLLHDPEELRQRTAEAREEYGRSIAPLDLIAGPAHANRVGPRSQSGSSSRRHDSRSRSKAREQAPQNVQQRTQEQQWTFIRRDGTRVMVSLGLKVLRNSAGERTGLIATAVDLSVRQPLPGHAGLTHDALTGLIGQSLLEDRIAQAIKRSRRAASKVAVFTIDLDHFRRINDALGHPVGDEILTLAAGRLLEKVRSADTVARIGGDEFIVVISDQSSLSDIEFCAEQMLRALTAPYALQKHTINVTACVGICVYPELASDTEHLLRRSEAAMYAAKSAGRNRSTLFTSDMLEDATSRLSMEGALRQALDHDELFLEYQPQVALPSGKVIGMEALLRWKHPRFGIVSPAHFIPIAEKIGILPELGTWAMHRACREAKWIQNRLGRRVSLSVNLSPNQFEQKKLLRTIEQALEESGLAAADLEIEIIENTLMINSTANLETLQMIRDLGVGLSIDDFGTGFCNFNYLLQYQVDRLKIDQSFVRQAANDNNAASVVRTVIAMSHGLGVKVIAEGVETRDQLKFLMRRRCDQAQGYFFARPLSPQRFVESVAGIEAMNLSDPSGEHAAARIAAEEKNEFLLPNGALPHRSVSVV